MSHIDPDDLALIALRPAAATGAQRAHLAECAECAREERELARTVELGKAVDEGELLTPPPGVWGRIHSELGLSAAGADAPVVPIDGRDRRRVWPWAVAAVVVGILGGFGIAQLLASAAERVTVLADAVLDPLPGQSTSGSARVEEAPDGRRDVVVTLTGDVSAGGKDGTGREVWLLTEDATGLVSLGFLDGSSGRFAVPDGLDLARYPLVDVSVESFDGDPAHSGDSLARGPLRSQQ
jgi:hypothetical protein